jgi:hypothetical protein
MMAYYQTVKSMEGYEYHLQGLEQEKMNRKAKRK